VDAYPLGQEWGWVGPMFLWNLDYGVTLLRTDGERYIPVDYRIYNKKQDGLTKNDHFREMAQIVYDRGFRPECVCLNSWYASLKNLKLVICLFGRWLARLESEFLMT